MRWVAECELCTALREELIWVVLFLITLLLLMQDELTVTSYARPLYYPQLCTSSYHYYDRSNKSVTHGMLEITFREQHKAIIATKVRSPRSPEGITIHTVSYRYNRARDSLILYAPKKGESYEALEDMSLLSSKEKAAGVIGRLQFYRREGVTLLLRSSGGSVFQCSFL
ncbi:MAG: hypothetical protein ACRCWW_09335 [Scandinavium sp.]|uniref:hypothetical protein n=1 Tax=Scandinavium sp. TaxID=2830653 RepID=UPI003F2E0FF9